MSSMKVSVTALDRDKVRRPVSDETKNFTRAQSIRADR